MSCTKHTVSVGVAQTDEIDLNNLETAVGRVHDPNLVSSLICLGAGVTEDSYLKLNFAMFLYLSGLTLLWSSVSFLSFPFSLNI